MHLTNLKIKFTVLQRWDNTFSSTGYRSLNFIACALLDKAQAMKSWFYPLLLASTLSSRWNGEGSQVDLQAVHSVGRLTAADHIWRAESVSACRLIRTFWWFWRKPAAHCLLLVKKPWTNLQPFYKSPLMTKERVRKAA
jgi:hypothetical protein